MHRLLTLYYWMNQSDVTLFIYDSAVLAALCRIYKIQSSSVPCKHWKLWGSIEQSFNQISASTQHFKLNLSTQHIATVETETLFGIKLDRQEHNTDGCPQSYQIKPSCHPSRLVG